MISIDKVEDGQTFDSLLGEVVGFQTQFDVIRFMKKVVLAYGARLFMIYNLPAITSRELGENTIITNWPTALMGEFDRLGLMQGSVSLQRLRVSAVPFAFDMDDPAHVRAQPGMSESFSRAGLTRGAIFPVHDAAGRRGAVSIGGLTGFTDQQMLELSYLSIHVFQRLSDIRHIDVKVAEPLSDREIDCLNWTAAGKTSSEIAEILGLSEHTVNHYLNRAARKLDTVNRTQAVAKALRSGLIK